MSKIVKKLELDTLSKAFDGVKDLVLLSTTKVDSALDYNFRKTLREKKIRVQMVKNTLARKILEGNGIKLKDCWSGPTLVAWGSDSIKSLANTVESVIKDFEKKDPKSKEKLGFKTAVADGQQCTLEQAKVMPTRLEAIGEIIGMILGPGSAIAGALTGPASQVASQIAKKAEGEEAASADAAPAADATDATPAA
jgi:large subunit ribosomal protein L10